MIETYHPERSRGKHLVASSKEIAVKSPGCDAGKQYTDA
jgi:hypothetical protein